MQHHQQGFRDVVLIRTGAMTFDLMLYLTPSLASVLVKATRPTTKRVSEGDDNSILSWNALLAAE